MHITKTQGAILSLALMSPYLLLYYLFVSNTTHIVGLMTVFFAGIFLCYFRKIEPGTQAELIFSEKALGTFWSDGFCLVPTLFPILHYFDIHLLWNLKKPTEQHALVNSNTRIDIRHYRDQRQPEYHIKAEASLVGLHFTRFVGSILRWFVEIDRKNPELFYQSIGTRLIVLAIIAGFLLSH